MVDLCPLPPLSPDESMDFQTRLLDWQDARPGERIKDVRLLLLCATVMIQHSSCCDGVADEFRRRARLAASPDDVERTLQQAQQMYAGRDFRVAVSGVPPPPSTVFVWHQGPAHEVVDVADTPHREAPDAADETAYIMRRLLAAGPLTPGHRVLSVHDPSSDRVLTYASLCADGYVTLELPPSSDGSSARGIVVPPSSHGSSARGIIVSVDRLLYRATGRVGGAGAGWAAVGCHRLGGHRLGALLAARGLAIAQLQHHDYPQWKAACSHSRGLQLLGDAWRMLDECRETHQLGPDHDLGPELAGRALVRLRLPFRAPDVALYSAARVIHVSRGSRDGCLQVTLDVLHEPAATCLGIDTGQHPPPWLWTTRVSCISNELLSLRELAGLRQHGTPSQGPHVREGAARLLDTAEHRAARQADVQLLASRGADAGDELLNQLARQNLDGAAAVVRCLNLAAERGLRAGSTNPPSHADDERAPRAQGLVLARLSHEWHWRARGQRTRLQQFWCSRVQHYFPDSLTPWRPPERQMGTCDALVLGCPSAHAWLGEALSLNMPELLLYLRARPSPRVGDDPLLQQTVRTLEIWPPLWRRIGTDALDWLFGPDEAAREYDAYQEHVRTLKTATVEANFARCA